MIVDGPRPEVVNVTITDGRLVHPFLAWNHRHRHPALRIFRARIERTGASFDLEVGGGPGGLEEFLRRNRRPGVTVSAGLSASG